MKGKRLEELLEEAQRAVREGPRIPRREEAEELLKRTAADLEALKGVEPLQDFLETAERMLRAAEGGARREELAMAARLTLLAGVLEWWEERGRTPQA